MSEFLRSGSSRKVLAAAGLALVAWLVPQLVDSSWLFILTTTLIFAIVMAGFNILMVGGVLSLGQAFFMAVGGFGYAILAGEGSGSVSRPVLGFGFPPVIGIIGALAICGLVALLFSPVASRLSGLSFAAASLGLVVLGQHILDNAPEISGGIAGVRIPSVGGFGLLFSNPRQQWYLVAGLCAAALAYAHNIVKSRLGLALKAVSAGPIFAEVMGVRLRSARRGAVVASAVYAGLGGILLGATTGVLVPDTFGFSLTIEIAAMAIIGGTGSVVLGALIGACILVLIPELLNRYASMLPLVADSPGEASWMAPGSVSAYLYGGVIIAVLIFHPDGLASFLKRFRGPSKREGVPVSGESRMTN